MSEAACRWAALVSFPEWLSVLYMLQQGIKNLDCPSSALTGCTAPVFLFAHTFYTSIPVIFPLHPPIRSASLLKAISQSCRFTEGFPHIQTSMSQMDAAFMQIWKGPNSRCCWGRTLLVDFSRMWRFWEREHALLRTDPCFIIELSGVSLLHHLV